MKTHSFIPVVIIHALITLRSELGKPVFKNLHSVLYMKHSNTIANELQTNSFFLSMIYNIITFK